MPEGLVKVGRTNDPARRLSNYRTALPGAQFIVLKAVTDSVKSERRMLKLLKGKLSHGREWFDVTEEELHKIMRVS